MGHPRDYPRIQQNFQADKFLQMGGGIPQVFDPFPKTHWNTLSTRLLIQNSFETWGLFLQHLTYRSRVSPPSHDFIVIDIDKQLRYTSFFVAYSETWGQLNSLATHPKKIQLKMSETKKCYKHCKRHIAPKH